MIHYVRCLPIPFHSVYLIAAALPLAACAGDGGAVAGWRSEREIRGDTVVVTTTGGSVWSETSLVEDLRIGTLDGPEEYIFGGIL
jgi:hypothetical protein